jgi:YgiT-type zinc finger domain-containing protein
MKCVNCKTGNMAPGKTVLTFAEADSTIVVKDVDAMVCDLCGAWYLTPETLEEVRKVVESESRSGHEISVIRLSKVA